MKAKRIVNTLGMSKLEWLAHRKEGIGCSEVSTIMGLNPYQSSVELFYDKLGEVAEKKQTASMFMGTYLEDCIALLFCHWETDFETTMKNFQEKKQTFKVRKINAILQNPNFPFLLGNLDREIYFPIKAVLEIKTASGYSLDTWTAGIPPMFIVQSQAYMMVTGYSETKLAVLKDGRYLDVYDIYNNQEIQQGIEIRCKEFWERVEYAKKLKAEGKPFESYEPEPDSTVAYEKFMKEKFLNKPDRIEVGEDIHKVALQYVECNSHINNIKDKQQLFKNILISEMRGHELMSFGFEKGYCTLKANAKGTKTFLCKPVGKLEEVLEDVA